MACGEVMGVPLAVRKSAPFPGVRYVRCRECMTVQVAEAPPAGQIAAFYDRFYINDAHQTMPARLLGWLRGVSERARALTGGVRDEPSWRVHFVRITG